MKTWKGKGFLKLAVGLLTIALLSGSLFYGGLGVTATILDEETLVSSMLGELAYRDAQDAQDYYFYQKALDGVSKKELKSWQKQELEEYQQQFDKANTNFRYTVYVDGEKVAGNYKDEPAVAEASHWEDIFVGTETERARIDAYRYGMDYDYANDVPVERVYHDSDPETGEPVVTYEAMSEEDAAKQTKPPVYTMSQKEYDKLYDRAYQQVETWGYVLEEMTAEDLYQELYGLCMEIQTNREANLRKGIGMGLAGLVLLLFLLAAAVGTLYSGVARVKVKGWWRNCLCWKAAVVCWKLLVKCMKWLWKLCKS